MGFSDDARDRWYIHHHWQLRRVRDLSGRHEIHVWFPPDDRKRIAEEMADDEPQKRRPRKLLQSLSDTPKTWLSMLTAWEHLRASGLNVDGRGAFTPDKFLDLFFADWGKAAEILATMAHHDQSEVMKHFEIEKLHARTRAILQRARADYMASQAAREPDPIAEHG